MKPYSKIENSSFIVVHIFYDNKTQEVKTLSELQLKRFKKSKKWRQVLSCTKLQEIHQTTKIKIYPEGLKIKPSTSAFDQFIEDADLPQY